jgi:hypothetical protein
MNAMQPGMQLMQAQPNLDPTKNQPQQGGQPPSAGASSPLQQPPSNILQMTRQGQAMNAMTPPQQPQGMAKGGTLKSKYEIKPHYNDNEKRVGWAVHEGDYVHDVYPTKAYAMDVVKKLTEHDRNKEQPQSLANGGRMTVEQMKHELQGYASKGGVKNERNHPAILPPAPALSKQAIMEMAERIARQMTGELNPNKKTLQQLQREKDLPVDLRTTGKMIDMPLTSMTQHKGSYLVGVPGDTSVGGIEAPAHDLEPAKAAVHLHGIGNKEFEHSVPMFGGKFYGAYGHPEGWAGNEAGVQPLHSSVTALHEVDPNAKILGQYVKMTHQSLDFALHNLDALLAYQEPHKFPKENRERINKMLEEPYLGHKEYRASPGIEDPLELLLHAQMNSDYRKKLIKILSTKKNLPEGARSWDDVIFAISHPELRNLETGVSGGTVLRMDPHRNPMDLISPNPTYSRDLPSKVIAQTQYMQPTEIAYPRSMHYAREHIKTLPVEKQKHTQPFSTAKSIGFREPIDEQYINQLGEYETQLRRRLLGKKKGGKVKDNLDTMRLALTKNSKKAK